MRWPPLGWMPFTSIVSGLGLVLVAMADSQARSNEVGAGGLFWAGLILIVVPTALRLGGTGASRDERLALVAMLGLSFYVVKVLHDPSMFTFFDEFLHVRTADDILRTGSLFTPNALLPASPYYPGLETVTTALSSLSGGSVFSSGVIVLGAARLLLAIAMFLFFELVGASARVAGLAVFVYMASPSFLFFSSQFAYESLALPFAVFALFVIARRQRGMDAGPTSWILIGLAVSATVVTHHVTAFALSAFLIAWSAVGLARRLRSGVGSGPFMPAVLMVSATGAWILVVASVTISYLAPAIESTAREVIRLVSGEAGARQLFSASTAPSLPAWEQGVAYAAVALLLLGISIGVLRIWRGPPTTSGSVALALGALSYPVSLVARLTERGAELSARSSAFIFLAMGFVVAWGLPPGPRLRIPRLPGPVVAVALTLVMLGGVAIAVPVWARLPGPYLVAADPLSIEPQGIAAAEWTLANLGPENRFVADRTNQLLLGTVGRQHPVTGAGDRVNVRPAFFGLTIGPTESLALRAGRIGFVLIDRRLSSALPLSGVYMERGEPLQGERTEPIDEAALAKFDGVPGVSRLFDSGQIQIYDVSMLSRVPTPTP